MVKDSAHVVIAQEDYTTRSSIELALNIGYYSNGPNIHYIVNNPASVLAALEKYPVDMVITGQRFYHDSSLREIWNGIGEHSSDVKAEKRLREYAQKHPPPTSGTALSEALYAKDPIILTLVYSVQRTEERGHLAGKVPKLFMQENRYLLDFTTHPDLAEIIRTQNWQRLRSTFPRITFYPELETEHPMQA